MQKDSAARLRLKHPENSLHQQLVDQLGLRPAVADKGLELFLDWARINFDATRPAGQIVRTAVSADEPAGKPVRYCYTREVCLTVDHRYDLDILHRHGTVALRRLKVLRCSWEAYQQGALLSYEDLAALLCVDRSTVKRLVATLRVDGFLVPTRGLLHDMGRAPSHKEHIGRMLCRGYTYTEITAATGHSESAIERYALDLGRVIALKKLAATTNDIRIICQMGEKRLDTYLRLIRAHDTDEFRPHLEQLKRRFESGKGMLKLQLQPTKHRGDPVRRMREQNVHTATAQLLQDCLALTMPVAKLVTEKIDELHQRLFAHQDRLAPGQTILLVDSAASAPKYAGQRCREQRHLIPVVLSPWTDDKRELLLSDRPLSEKRALIADALARESQTQGGTMTVATLAMLLGTSQASLAAALATLRRQQDEPTPIKGITEDAGATLTHKELICDLHDEGRTPPEISHITCHAPESRDRYLKTNLRVETLTHVLRHIPDEVRASRFLGIQKNVVKQYLSRLQRRRDADKTLTPPPNTPTPSAVATHQRPQQVSP